MPTQTENFKLYHIGLIIPHTHAPQVGNIVRINSYACVQISTNIMQPSTFDQLDRLQHLANISAESFRKCLNSVIKVKNGLLNL